MKDGIGAGEPAKASRQEIYGTYVNFYRQFCTEVGPCRDARLLSSAAQYLLREPAPPGSFTVFPFYQAVSEGPATLDIDSRKHLCSFIKATELLETLCVNLFVQPWKKEIKALKTFTGPFVYCLLPVLSSYTIKSVLASIGYLPHGDTPSEFRLSDDANPDKAIQVGFELLLARVVCSHFLELLEKDQLGPQEWLEVLQRRVSHRKLREPTEKKTTTQPEEQESMNKEEADRKEVPLNLVTRLALHLQSRPPHSHSMSIDQSFMEMQRTYPDLAFRGRPLVPDKPHQANRSRNNSKDIPTAGHESKGAELQKRDSVRGTVATSAVCSETYGGKADEEFGDNTRSCHDKNSSGTSLPENTISCSTDGSGVNDLSGPLAISLHITQSESKAEKVLKPGEPHPLGWMQHQAAADVQNKNPANSELSPLSSVDDEQDLRELVQRMGQIHDTKEEVKKKEMHKKGGENKNRQRRKKWKKSNRDEVPEERNLRKPVMETGPTLECDSSRCIRSFQSEQKQPNGCHPSHMAVTSTDCESCKGGGSVEQWVEADPGRVDTGREEEQLAHSFVLVESHKN